VIFAAGKSSRHLSCLDGFLTREVSVCWKAFHLDDKLLLVIKTMRARQTLIYFLLLKIKPMTSLQET
jgi:hypothetical protein